VCLLQVLQLSSLRLLFCCCWGREEQKAPIWPACHTLELAGCVVWVHSTWQLHHQQGHCCVLPNMQQCQLGPVLHLCAELACKGGVYINAGTACRTIELHTLQNGRHVPLPDAKG
jgi:hypothetical protein